MELTPLERTRRKLEGEKFNLSGAAPVDGAYVFFSFDLVNSTKYKALSPSVWPIVVTRFYDFVANEMATRFTSARIWKHVGDEILFYKALTSKRDLRKCLPLAREALLASIALLHQAHPDTKPILSVKGSIWIANVEYIAPADTQKVHLRQRNLVTGLRGMLEGPDQDFLGPEIDAGFRLAKYVQHRRLIVSAHLASLLFRDRAKNKSIEDKLKIVAFEELRGVWDGRRYPIIWYEEDWSSIGETFLYDEHLVSPMAASVQDGLLGPEHHLRYIERVFDDLGKNQEIVDLEHAIDTASVSDSQPIEIEIPRDRFAEIHCAAICFDEAGRVLAGKRPAGKKRLPSVWEFGCGQPKLGESFAACLQRSYGDDFGAKLDFLSAEPRPIASFTLQDPDERRSIPGILFVARVSNGADISESFLKEKHSDVKWISEEELESLKADDFVPDFVDNVRAGLSALKSISQGVKPDAGNAHEESPQG